MSAPSRAERALLPAVTRRGDRRRKRRRRAAWRSVSAPRSRVVAPAERSTTTSHPAKRSSVSRAKAVRAGAVSGASIAGCWSTHHTAMSSKRAGCGGRSDGNSFVSRRVAVPVAAREPGHTQQGLQRRIAGASRAKATSSGRSDVATSRARFGSAAIHVVMGSHHSRDGGWNAATFRS